MFLFKGKRIFIYLWAQLCVWCGLVLAAIVFLFLFSQALRVAPLFAGAGVTFWELLQLAATLLVPVAGWGLTPAVMISIFAVVGRMHADGELTALEAAGVTPGRTASALLFFAVFVCVGSALIWLWAGPLASGAARQQTMEFAERAVMGHVRPGRFYSFADGMTFYGERGHEGRFAEVFLEAGGRDGKPVSIFAAAAEIHRSTEEHQLLVQLERGTMLSGAEEGRLAVQFEELEVVLPIGDLARGSLDFLPPILTKTTPMLVSRRNEPGFAFEFWRRCAGPVGLLGLALVSVLLAAGLSWSRRSWAIGTAAALFVLYHLLYRACEGWWEAGLLGPVQAGLGPPIVVTVFGALLFVVRQTIVPRRILL